MGQKCKVEVPPETKIAICFNEDASECWVSVDGNELVDMKKQPDLNNNYPIEGTINGLDNINLVHKRGSSPCCVVIWGKLYCWC